MTMSARELQWIEVLTKVLSGRRDVGSGATVLAVSVRQMHRLLARYREGGGGALVHKARGQSSNNQLNVGIREYALERVRQPSRKTLPPLTAVTSSNKGRCGQTRMISYQQI